MPKTSITKVILLSNIRYDEKTGLLNAIKTNLTLINLFLLIKGPTSEKNLCRYLLTF